MPEYSAGDRFVREQHVQGEVAAEVTIELREYDPELDLWSYEVVDVDQFIEDVPRIYYEGRTVGCRVKTSVLESEHEKL
jgi:hypothetical protein